jgi:hypothetical protein
MKFTYPNGIIELSQRRIMYDVQLPYSTFLHFKCIQLLPTSSNCSLEDLAV